MRTGGAAADPWACRGYRRADGRLGIRNHVAVIAAADMANPAVRRLAAAAPGAVAVTALYGRGQLGEDYEQTVRTLAGLGANANVSAALVISLEPVAAGRVAEGIARSGKPVEVLSIQESGGTPRLTARGTRLLRALLRDARRQRREPARLAEVMLGLECGGSDATSGLVANPAIGLVTDRFVDAGGTAVFSEPVECLGAEPLLAARAATPAAARAVLRTVAKYEAIARRAGLDLTHVNPTADNIRGGLTTIEEKSLGAVAKSGSRPIRGVLAYAGRPPGPGLYLMDAPAAATENLTALAGGGAGAILFATGAGNPVGNPLVPTLKICANPRTCRTFRDHIDVDISGCLAGRATLGDAARRVEEALLAVANGRLTRCEVLGEVETAISRIGPSV